VADYQSRRRLLQTRIAAFNEARTADPDATVAAMVKAHHLARAWRCKPVTHRLWRR